MSARYDIELEPEVREWLDTLRLKDYAKVEAMADIFADRAETLGEPYSRHLSGKTRELRFHLDRSAVRISYWLAPGARAVLLTVFRKTRQIERGEVARAIAAQQECESGHEAHAPATETYERKWHWEIGGTGR
ncbi:type II toxin-antitoxin system RelE/ParE family toxin [Symbioplanes lichenis]|uniref:type II toxin-antitoxin system RelE/ParE family toxin n=1 Tax=Symbioplanes lichenis TaxID=1629072 RepID=UPI002738C499|nr:type II toxin-antitoxin system RelE/ParE family toxin [Actinoplanes lichenis]